MRLIARPSRKSSIPSSTSRTKVNTPSTNSVGSATSAKTRTTVPPLDTCAVRPRPTSALDTLPRNSAERDAAGGQHECPGLVADVLDGDLAAVRVTGPQATGGEDRAVGKRRGDQ